MPIIVDPNAIYDLEELAELLSVHKRTLREAMAAGRLPGRKASKRWLIAGRAIIEWIATPDPPDSADDAGTDRLPDVR